MFSSCWGGGGTRQVVAFCVWCAKAIRRRDRPTAGWGGGRQERGARPCKDFSPPPLVLLPLYAGVEAHVVGQTRRSLINPRIPKPKKFADISNPRNPGTFTRILDPELSLIGEESGKQELQVVWKRGG
jgi:hypothetical protein